ncbi:hypothetical protein WMY93_032400 [Mugilogobius chulae]|uniref:Uncharacterized protein n=1 Tax=Mugilogobius chulae TaxID=88201 RepID=A0AAW0MWV1_9GOBI
MEEAETRIATTEDRVQGAEDVITELVKQQIRLQQKLSDLEGRSRWENVRIYGVPEGSEGTSASSFIPFVEQLLRENLGLSATKDLLIERAHRALAPRPPEGFPEDETKIYDSVEEAASDLADKGLPVTRVTRPDSLLLRLQQYTWAPAQSRRKTGFKEKLQAFRRDPPVNTSA